MWRCSHCPQASCALSHPYHKPGGITPWTQTGRASSSVEVERTLTPASPSSLVSGSPATPWWRGQPTPAGRGTRVWCCWGGCLMVVRLPVRLLPWRGCRWGQHFLYSILSCKCNTVCEEGDRKWLTLAPITIFYIWCSYVTLKERPSITRVSIYWLVPFFWFITLKK